MQSDGVNFFYFKLRLFDQTKFRESTLFLFFLWHRGRKGIKEKDNLKKEKEKKRGRPGK